MSSVGSLFQAIQPKQQKTVIVGNQLTPNRAPTFIPGLVLEAFQVPGDEAGENIWNWKVGYYEGEATVEQTLIHYAPQSSHELSSDVDDEGNFSYVPRAGQQVLMTREFSGELTIVAILEGTRVDANRRI